MNNVNDMLTFLAVAESGSFTSAAEILNTPKSNISRKITKLEQGLDVRLLERTTRSINLTEAGRIYLQHCQRVKEEIDGAEQSLEQLKSVPSGTLKICTTVTVGQHLLAQPFIRFQQANPKITLDLQLINRRVDIIEEGYDVAFRVGESADSNLISKRLCALNLNLYVSPQRYNSSTINDIPDITSFPCLHMTGYSGTAAYPLKQAKDKQLSFSPSIVCNDFNLLYQACLAGSGFALLPSYMCDKAEQEGRLIKVKPDEIGRTVDIYAIYPSRKGKLPKLEALLEFIQQGL